MSSDSSEPAFDWGESDDGLVLGDEAASVAPRRSGPRTTSPGTLAVFGGLYAVWSVAWVLGIAAAPTQPASSVLDAVMFQFGEFLALVCAPLWFGIVWWLTSGVATWVRVSVLSAGLIILVPLPLILPVLS